MKRWSLCVFAVVAVLVVIPITMMARGGADRPFTAVLTGAAHWEFPGPLGSPCTVVTTVTEATGQGTHLGTVSFYSTHCPAEPDNVLDGRMTLTAANGDTLVGRYNYDPASASVPLAVNWTEGTGRFAGVSGAAVGTYSVTPQFIEGCVPSPDPFPCYDFSVPWPWSATLKGTISY